MKLTHEMFEAGRSERGGHNLAQLKALGLDGMPERGWPVAGWPARLIGSEVTEAQYSLFLAMRGKTPREAREMSSEQLLKSTPTLGTTETSFPDDRNTEDELMGWLRNKLAEAEKSVRAREQAEDCWSSGTNKEWEASAKLHPDTANEPPIKKAERMFISAAEGRIAEKCRRDVAMFKAILSILTPVAEQLTPEQVAQEIYEQSGRDLS